jgi:DNA-binding SARP family transcriptional activator
MASARRIDAPAADSRALYRRGLAESHRGEIRALQSLAAAMDSLRAAGDRPGAALAAAALLVTSHCMYSYRRFGELTEALSGLRDGSIAYADHGDSLIAHAGLLCGLLMLRPSDPFIDVCVARIMSLLELDLDVNAKFAAGRLVIYYTEPREQRELGQRVYALLQPLIEHTDLTPHRLGRWLIVWIRSTADAKDPAQHQRAREQARTLADRHREPEVVAWLAGAEIEQALPARDFDRIERALATVERISDPANLSEVARLAWFRGRVALARGEGDAALFYAARARKIGEELELPPPMFGVRLALEAQARVLVGDFAGARELFRRTADMVALLHAEEMRDMIRMVDAYEALQKRRPDARALLAAAFAAPRSRQFYDTFDTNPSFGATLCALALEHGVETEFVGRIIEVQRMAPPAEARASWPWPLRIETLGRFALTRAGTAMAVRGKTQKKPLELLKALIAFGGRGVDKQRLGDALWPDAEPDAAPAALDMAISRLRKLVGLPEVIVIEDGKVGLDPAQVWVDTWTFDRDVEALQAALRETGDGAAVAELGERLLALYRGAFLDNDEPERWMLAARDRWRNRFLRSLSDAGRYHERHENWAEAIALYERGIEVDTLAEDLYRRLMRCQLARGQPAEAARVYRRCREMLSVQLGIAPSAETEALFQSIYGR